MDNVPNFLKTNQNLPDGTVKTEVENPPAPEPQVPAQESAGEGKQESIQTQQPVQEDGQRQEPPKTTPDDSGEKEENLAIDENLTDFSLPDSAGENETPPAEDQNEWLNAIKESTGQSFENPDAFKTYLQNRQQVNPKDRSQKEGFFSPLSSESKGGESPKIPQTIREKELDLISSRVLSKTEISTGNLEDVSIPKDMDEATAAALVYQATMLGQDISDDEIAEELSEMSAFQKRSAVMSYKQSLQAQKQAAMQQLSSLRQQADQEQMVSLRQQQAEQEAYFQKADGVIKEMSHISGTKTAMDDKMKGLVAHAMKNPDFLRSMIFPDTGNDQKDMAFAANQIARLAFSGKIAKELGVAARNGAKRELLDAHSGIQQSVGDGGVQTKTKSESVNQSFGQFLQQQSKF